MKRVIWIQLFVSTLLLVAAGLFVTTALAVNRLATGWTAWSMWTAALTVPAVAAALGPWLWAQTVRWQRLLIGAVVVGSGAGLLVLMPGMSYLFVFGAQAALTAGALAEASVAPAD